MIWLYYILLLLITAAGLVLVVLTLPGLWLITASSAIYALLTHQHSLGFKTLAALFLLSLAGEAFELFSGSAAARKSGGSRRGMIGGIVGGIAGGIIGSFFLPIVLSIVGICIGSFIGAAGLELLGGQQAVQSMSIGLSAAKGRFAGMIVKFGIGLVMLLLVLVCAFP
jgi:uncharacterized protein